MSVETDAMDAAVPDLEDGREPEPGEEAVVTPERGTVTGGGKSVPVQAGDQIAVEVTTGTPVVTPGGGPDEAAGPEEAAGPDPDLPGCFHEASTMVGRTHTGQRHRGAERVRWCAACGGLRVGTKDWQMPTGALPVRTEGTWST